MSSVANISLGFGGYVIPENKTYSQMQLSDKVQKVALAILLGLLALSSIALISLSLPLALVTIPTFSFFAIQAMLRALGVFYRSPPTQTLFPPAVEAAVDPLNKVSPKPINGLATRDGVDSHAQKLNLIRSAKHNIFISGCYCGGTVFDETLQLIRTQMRTHPALTTSILASSVFVTAENRTLIGELEREFGPRFTCVITPEVFPYTSPTTDTFSLSTNHTKALVIDYGAAYMLGGSGIVSTWSGQMGKAPTEQIERQGLFFDYVMRMKAFRDMDFVFHSPELGGIGTRLYLEMHKLLERFQPHANPPPTEWPARIEPLPLPGEIGQLRATLYATGPDQPSSAFLDEIVAQVKGARHKIVFGHMYFHPPKKLLDALIEASNRGVQITLMTNKLGGQSPGSHITYAELSRYNAKLLFEGRDKPNIEYYEFDVPYTTFHKKVILIDDRVGIYGSANIGKKSLESVDYEIDIKVESEAFTRSVAAILEEDKRYCHRVQDPHISLKTRALATFQTLFVPFL